MVTKIQFNMKSSIDSKDELYFTWYLDELVEVGIIEQYTKGKTYNLSEKVVGEYTKQLVKKTKEVEQTYLQPHEYSPDFEIFWSYGVKNTLKFIHFILSNTKWDKQPFIVNVDEMMNRLHSIVEIKPKFDQNNMTRLFRLNQKWMYDKYSIYVNEIEYNKLFAETFTPKRFLLTDKSNQQRVIHWKVKSLEEYLNE